MKLSLIGLFFLTALLYAAVGFGGGSTYTALLVLFEVDYRLIPTVALLCNILVVTGNCLRYQKRGLVPWARLWPLLVLSVPAAWIGGRLEISEFVFIGLLWVALLLAGLRLLLSAPLRPAERKRETPAVVNASIGGAIGFYAGLVGIGGGIFLAPILHFIGWGEREVRSKQIAAACSVFILINSIAGLSGQLTKLGNTGQIAEFAPFWPLFPAVIIGGFIGNALGVFRLSEVIVKRLTAVLILAVALRLALRWFAMV